MSRPDDPARWTDLERPPLDPQALTRALVRDGSPWTSLQVVAATGSTNEDLAAGARSGTAPAGAVLVAEQQTAGRGRLDRQWVSPPRAGLTFSVLLAPPVPAARWGWLPLLTGLAVVEAVQAVCEVPAALKWPNDVLAADGRKLAGILAERVEAAGTAYAVVGVGLNVSTTGDELPVDTATSLLLAGAEHADRQPLLVAVLRGLATRVAAWAEGSDPLDDYRAASATIGREVRVEVAAADPVQGTAVDVDATGRLVVVAADGHATAVSAGDVMHLR